MRALVVWSYATLHCYYVTINFLIYVVFLGNDTGISCTNRYWNTSQKCKTGVCISKGSSQRGKLVTHTINLCSIQVKYVHTQIV